MRNLPSFAEIAGHGISDPRVRLIFECGSQLLVSDLAGSRNLQGRQCAASAVVTVHPGANVFLARGDECGDGWTGGRSDLTEVLCGGAFGLFVREEVCKNCNRFFAWLAPAEKR